MKAQKRLNAGLKLLIGAATVCVGVAVTAPVHATAPTEMQVAVVYSYCLTPVLSCEILGAWRLGTPCHCFLPYGGSANGEVI